MLQVKYQGYGLQADFLKSSKRYKIDLILKYFDSEVFGAMGLMKQLLKNIDLRSVGVTTKNI